MRIRILDVNMMKPNMNIYLNLLLLITMSPDHFTSMLSVPTFDRTNQTYATLGIIG